MNQAQKINIYVPRHIGETLENDAMLFEIYKTNLTDINKNKFLNLLIKNYYELYQSENKQKYENILSAIDSKKISSKERTKIAKTIFNKLFVPSIPGRGKNKTTKLSLKTTINSQLTIDEIMKDIGFEYHISQYFSRMLYCYCEKPIFEREKIIFQDNYELLERCCKEKKTIVFNTTWNTNCSHKVIPYKIVTGPEEMHNYLLCAEISPDNKQLEKSYCLNRINKLECKRTKIDIDETVLNHLKMMEQQGPAYSIHEETEYCIFLTEAGRVNYNKIYYGRPKYSKKEPTENGYYYYFNCSEDQLFLYFRRFGCDATIISPSSLKERIVDFHSNAYHVYIQTEKS